MVNMCLTRCCVWRDTHSIDAEVERVAHHHFMGRRRWGTSSSGRHISDCKACVNTLSTSYKLHLTVNHRGGGHRKITL
jgi:hypothetical protein